jgi:phospholipid-binding lipoprotein MlaA
MNLPGPGGRPGGDDVYALTTRVALATTAAVLVVGLAACSVTRPGVAHPDATETAAAPVPTFAPAPAASVEDPPLDESDADTEKAAAGFPDPLEGVNRRTFAFNRKVDAWFIDPMTRAYRFVVPASARRALRRALVNLDAPVTFVNDVLQLEPRDAAVTATRFVLNTTVGVVGLWDAAGDLAHLPGHDSDFGQTLALSGVPSGPYLMLPVLGPNNARDVVGYVVDFLFRPTSYLLTPGGALVISGFLNPGSELIFTTLFEGSTELAEGIATREASGDAMAALEASSLDYYAALRNAYYQNRVALIWRRGPDHGPLARARWVLAGLSLASARREVSDLRPDRGEEGVEALALEH